MARAVGNALHKNPDPSTIPCHRVVNSKGELAGEFVFGGPGVQASRLAAEGVMSEDGKIDLKDSISLSKLLLKQCTKNKMGC